MLISLHKQATTTPKVRAAIQASDEPAWKVAEPLRHFRADGVEMAGTGTAPRIAATPRTGCRRR